MFNRHPDFKKITDRPAPKDRLFVSEAIEDEIEEVASKIGDPEIKQMFRQTFPSTLDTAVSYKEDTDRKPDTLNYIYVVGDDKISSDLKTISEAQNNKYTKLQLDYKYNDPNDKERIYYRSDHYNFARYGVPIIFYYDGMLRPDYHKPTDTPDKVNYELLKKRAELVFYTGWEMANRDAMLKRDIPLTPPPGF